MRYVEQAARMIAQELDHSAILINKSTVPVGSGDLVARLMHEHLARPAVPFSVVSNPEFLSEGTAVHDFQHPDRIVLALPIRRLPVGLRNCTCRYELRLC